MKGVQVIVNIFIDITITEIKFSIEQFNRLEVYSKKIYFP
jgi:hypothetical protein